MCGTSTAQSWTIGSSESTTTGALWRGGSGAEAGTEDRCACPTKEPWPTAAELLPVLQVRDEYREDYDPQRGGWGKAVRDQGYLRSQEGGLDGEAPF